MEKINLRDKFPLSNKKYWKKIISILISKIIFVGVFLFSVMVFNWIQKDAPSDSAQFFTVTRIVLEVSIGLIILHFFYRIWYVGEYIKKYFYSSDDKFITIKKGVFTPTEIHVQYQKIQDVYVDQSLLDKTFGLYDVHISSATITSGIEAHIDGVDKEAAENLKEYLLSKISVGEVKKNEPSVEKEKIIPSNIEDVKFSFEISNKFFPLSHKWFIKKIISIIANSLLISIFLGFSLIIPDEKLSGSAKSLIGLSNETFLVLLFLFFSVISIIAIIRLYIWSKNYTFSFLSEFIEYKDGVFSRNERNIPYKNIQDISISQSFRDKIFGLCSISIKNASAQSVNNPYSNDIQIQGLLREDSEKIANELKRVIFGKINPNSSGL